MSRHWPLASRLPVVGHVTVRITIGEDAEGAIVEVAGRLDADGAAELEAVMAALSGSLRVDLGGLRSTDSAGVEALRTLRARGVSLTRMSTYHRLLLEGAEGNASSPSSSSEGRRGNRTRRRGGPGRG